MHYPHPIELRARRRRLSLIAAALLVVAGVIAYLCWPSEPYYNGRSLSSWLEDYVNPFARIRRGDFSMMNGSGVESTRRAVEAIGTNAIPTLLRFVRVKDSGPRQWLSPPGAYPMGPRIGARSAWEKHMMAQMGFAILGTNAMPAVPALVEMTRDKDPETRMRAFECLVVIKPDNFKTLLPILVSFAHDPDRQNREKAAHEMQLLLPMLSPEEAKEAGVYEAFPDLKLPVETGPKLHI
jgi:hypothetical protein